MTSTALRRSLYAAFTVTAAGGAAIAALTVPATPATAAPDPCAASQVAKTVAAVATNTSNYLAANPETDQALTTMSQQQAGPASLAALKTYFDANPDVAQDLQKLQQPLATLSGRCKLPITIPQVLGLMQAAQQNGGVQAALPGAAQAALPGGTTGSPVSAVTPGAGPLPGPGAASQG